MELGHDATKDSKNLGKTNNSGCVETRFFFATPTAFLSILFF